MDAKKKRKLRKLGGRGTTVAEFLDLSEAEQAVIELRLDWRRSPEAAHRRVHDAGSTREGDQPL